MNHQRLKQQGVTLLELLMAVAISALLIAGIQGLIGTAFNAENNTRTQNDNVQQARFAMQAMVNAVTGTQRLLIPLGENTTTAWSESVRDVLAVTLDPRIDRDKDGWADANNDKDFLDINQNSTRDANEPERIDEDPPGDLTNDLKAGIIGIDDDNDGSIDEEHTGSGPVGDDDDEDGTANEDQWNGLDDDGDNTFDEDPKKQMTDDGLAGVALVDDDLDGTVDEGDKNDDDEDGLIDEDWLDPVVFFLNGTTLMQRIPNINPVDGTDYTEYPIADNVTQLQVERLIGSDGTTLLVDISLQISPANMEPINLNTRVRVGAGL